MTICEYCREKEALNRFCSLSCSNRWRGTANAWPIGYCLVCEHFFNKKGDLRKKYCSRSCAVTINNKLSPKRKLTSSCLRCNAPISKSRTWCSMKCQSLYKTEQWLNGNISGGTGTHEDCLANYARKWVINQYGERCWVCGWDTVNPTTGNVPVQVDHIDGNSRNNRPENLRLLCPNCHSLTSTFGSLNKGNGRQSRQDLRTKNLEQ